MTKRRYGKWAGNLKGWLEDEECCIARVYDSEDWINHQCRRARGHGKDGLYCKQHAKKYPNGDPCMHMVEESEEEK